MTKLERIQELVAEGRVVVKDESPEDSSGYFTKYEFLYEEDLEEVDQLDNPAEDSDLLRQWYYGS